MGISDRRYDQGGYGGDGGQGGGFRDAFRRMFSGGDFFSWSVPLFSFRGVVVKIHLLFIVYVAWTLITAAIRTDVTGVKYFASFYTLLFLIVLLHEFGHVFACRWVGGDANEILLWPLGGLAMCLPPHHWKAAFITTAGGPLVNVILWPIFAGLLLLIGADWGAIIFNPFVDVFNVPWASGLNAWWKVVLWNAYFANIVLLAFNVLLPMFPLDGGRMLQELLWRKLGYRRSLTIAANIGLALAVLVGLFAMMSQPPQGALFAVAVFAGFTCYNERRRAEFFDEEFHTAYDRDRGRTRAEDRKYKEALKQQQREQHDQAEVDRILAKIAATGMDSLSRAERRALQRATESKRRG